MKNWVIDQSDDIKNLSDEMNRDPVQIPTRVKLFFTNSVDVITDHKMALDSFVGQCLNTELQVHSWFPIERADVFTRLKDSIAFDLAYQSEIIDVDYSKDLAQKFIDLFSVPLSEIAFYSNKIWNPKMNHWGSGFLLTAATFDIGIIGVSPHRMGLFLAEDED